MTHTVDKLCQKGYDNTMSKNYLQSVRVRKPTFIALKKLKHEMTREAKAKGERPKTYGDVVSYLVLRYQAETDDKEL